MKKCLELKDVSLYRKQNNKQKDVLKDVDFKLKQGELTILSGPSGQGKTTLLEILAGLQKPAKGDVVWDGKILYKEDLPMRAVDRMRNRLMGLFFWDHRLSSHLTGWENILLPAQLSGEIPDQQLIRDLVHVFFRSEEKEEEKILDKACRKMSAGQQERIAVIRSFVLSPPFILADEMLRSVDPELRDDLWALIKQKCREKEIGLLLVSHHKEILEDSDVDCVYSLEGGSISVRK